jgi:hypothetical protein
MGYIVGIHNFPFEIEEFIRKAAEIKLKLLL